MKIKHLTLLLLFITFSSCSDDEETAPKFDFDISSNASVLPDGTADLLCTSLELTLNLSEEIDFARAVISGDLNFEINSSDTDNLIKDNTGQVTSVIFEPIDLLGDLETDKNITITVFDSNQNTVSKELIVTYDALDQLSRLFGSWTVVFASYKQNDGRDFFTTVDSDFEGFEISIKDDLSYTTNSLDIHRAPNPWPSSGTFMNVCLFNQGFFQRDDGVNGTSLQIFTRDGTERFSLKFPFDSSVNNIGFGTSTGDIDEVNGEWSFEFMPE